MMRRSSLLCLVFGLLLAAPAFLPGNHFAAADEDEVDEDEGTVEPDEPAQDKDAEAEDELSETVSSPDAETVIVFTQPANNKDLPAGKLVNFLVSLYNKGDKDFTVDSLDCSFRYPQDYSFYIQNYTAARYNRVVPANSEASFDYAFVPAESFSARPFGLTVNLNYHDSDGVTYQNAVFNETVNIVEDESGFNPETGFLYVVFACVVVLGLLLGQQGLNKVRRKAGMGAKKRYEPAVEMGTAGNRNQVDLDWIPREHISIANKSPKPGSPKQGKSPRQRRARKEGAD